MDETTYKIASNGNTLTYPNCNGYIGYDTRRTFYMSGTIGVANSARNAWWNTPVITYLNCNNCKAADIVSSQDVTFNYMLTGPTYHSYVGGGDANKLAFKPGIKIDLDVGITSNFRVQGNAGSTAEHGYSYYSAGQNIKVGTKTTATSNEWDYYPEEYHFNIQTNIPYKNNEPCTGFTFGLYNEAINTTAVRCGWDPIATFSASGVLLDENVFEKRRYEYTIFGSPTAVGVSAGTVSMPFSAFDQIGIRTCWYASLDKNGSNIMWFNPTAFKSTTGQYNLCYFNAANNYALTQQPFNYNNTAKTFNCPNDTSTAWRNLYTTVGSNAKFQSYNNGTNRIKLVGQIIGVKYQ